MSEKTPQSGSPAEQEPRDPRQHPDYVPVEENPEDVVFNESIIRSDGSLDGGWLMKGTLGKGRVYVKAFTTPGKEHELGAVKYVNPDQLVARDALLEERRRAAGTGTIEAVKTADIMAADTVPILASEYVPLSADELAEQRRDAGMFTPSEIDAIRKNPSETEGPSYDKLLEGLSLEDREALRGYAEAKLQKKRAQQDGDGDASTRQGQYAGLYYNALSPDAKRIADQYVVRFNS